MSILNKTIYPKGGYRFRDPDGTTFKADSWDALIQSVRDYRTRNRFPVGDPAAEVTAQACRNNPTICRPSPSSPAGPPPREPSLRGKVIMWLSAARKQRQTDGKLSLVPPALAASRVAVCRACPQRVEIPNTCSVCGDAVKLIRENVLGQAPHSSDLGACSALAIDLPVAVHLDEAALQRPELPAACWRKAANANS